MKERELRRRIAEEAARLIYAGDEIDYPRAKRRAARSIGMRFSSKTLPSNRDVREEVEHLQDALSAAAIGMERRGALIAALRLMRGMDNVRPKLRLSNGLAPVPSLVDPAPAGSDSGTGADASGEANQAEGSPRVTRLDMVVFHDDPMEASKPLHETASDVSIGFRRSLPAPWPGEFVVIEAVGAISWRVAVLPAALGGSNDFPDPFSPETPAEFLDRNQLEERLRMEAPDRDLDREIEGLDSRVDRFDLYRTMLVELEEVKQDARVHPEGDALFHSLQVFELACGERSYDEEFLTAALLHDVGKVVDPVDHQEATLDLLEGIVTLRTRRLIAGMLMGRKYRRRELSADERRAFEQTEDFEDIALLVEFDESGRKRGARTRTLDEVLGHLRDLDSDSDDMDVAPGDADERAATL